MFEIIKYFYNKEGLKAQCVIMPILLIIELALDPNKTFLGHLKSFLILYLATMFIAVSMVYLGKKL